MNLDASTNQNQVLDSIINNNPLSTPTKNILNNDSDKKNLNLSASINMISDKTFDLDSVILNKDDITEDDDYTQEKMLNKKRGRNGGNKKGKERLMEKIKDKEKKSKYD